MNYLKLGLHTNFKEDMNGFGGTSKIGFERKIIQDETQDSFLGGFLNTNEIIFK